MTAMKGKSGNSGDWGTGSNWSSGSVAGIGDDATIAAAGPNADTILPAEAANSLTRGAAGVSAT